MQVNGKLTLDENLVDYLGFMHALKAYRMYVRDHGPDKRFTQFEHFSHEKLLAMAFANVSPHTDTDYTLEAADALRSSGN